MFSSHPLIWFKRCSTQGLCLFIKSICFISRREMNIKSPQNTHDTIVKTGLLEACGTAGGPALPSLKGAAAHALLPPTAPLLHQRHDWRPSTTQLMRVVSTCANEPGQAGKWEQDPLWPADEPLSSRAPGTSAAGSSRPGGWKPLWVCLVGAWGTQSWWAPDSYLCNVWCSKGVLPLHVASWDPALTWQGAH